MVPFSTSSFLTPLALICPSGHSMYRGLGVQVQTCISGGTGEHLQTPPHFTTPHQKVV